GWRCQDQGAVRRRVVGLGLDGELAQRFQDARTQQLVRRLQAVDEVREVLRAGLAQSNLHKHVGEGAAQLLPAENVLVFRQTLRQGAQRRQQFGTGFVLETLSEAQRRQRDLVAHRQELLSIRDRVDGQDFAEDVLQEGSETVAAGPGLRSLVPRRQV